jgi:hypothetical protein
MEESKHLEFSSIRLKGLENDTRAVENLKKHMDVCRTLELCKVPNRTNVGSARACEEGGDGYGWLDKLGC